MLSPKRTLPTARAFVRQFYWQCKRGTIVFYAGVLLVWRGNCWRSLEEEALRQRLQPWLHEAIRYAYDRASGEMVLLPFESNPRSVNAALDSIKTFVHIPEGTPVPSWFDREYEQPPATELLPCASVLLHLPTMRRLLATPLLFNTNALEFDHEPSAPEPRLWLEFLGQLFGDDVQALELLQEWFGYVLILDTSQQKMLLLIGPRRSGKGTIARVLSALIGLSNICGPTTSSLAGPFGLQPLIGKSLAIVSDARFSGDRIQTVVERLLCISGEDAVTIDRKFLPSVTLKLPTRFMFLTNELPRLRDASGALAGRFLLLRLIRSFYGDEDIRLTDKLLEELPGILNWAIEGWRRLQARGHFVQPSSVGDAIQELEDLSSPVKAFLRERCEVGPGFRVSVDDLYSAWQRWCEQDGRDNVTTKQTFGRDLAAALPSVVCRRNQQLGRFYEGVSLRMGGLS